MQDALGLGTGTVEQIYPLAVIVEVGPALAVHRIASPRDLVASLGWLTRCHGQFGSPSMFL